MRQFYSAGQVPLQQLDELAAMAALYSPEGDSSTATLLRGLVAVGLAAAREYHKELIVLLPLFDRSARKLTIDPDALFEAATEILGEAAPEWLRRFPERSEAERDLARMRYEERPSDNGLLYARSGRMMSREEVEELQRRLEG